MGQAAEAEPLFRHALAISERAYGPELPDVATLLNNLASCLYQIGRLAEGEPLFCRALGILRRFQKSTGYIHPNFRLSLRNYISCLHHLGLSEPEIQQRIQEFQPPQE